MTEPTPAIDPATLRIEGGYLVEVSSQCTCGSGGFSEHEQYCDIVPIVTVAELAALISAPEGLR